MSDIMVWTTYFSMPRLFLYNNHRPYILSIIIKCFINVSCSYHVFNIFLVYLLLRLPVVLSILTKSVLWIINYML